MKFGRKWSYGLYSHKNGAKHFGAKLWFNNQRVGIELNCWVWELFVMRDF